MEILRLAAFTDDPRGGNPAGVVLDAAALSPADMQRIAADVGYSETAFVVGSDGARQHVRFFSPAAEVPFCGHATIATAVAMAKRGAGPELVFSTRAGDVRVSTTVRDGRASATLTSVPPYVEPVTPEVVREALESLRWADVELDPSLPPAVAFAGARHLVLVAGSRTRLADLDYDFERLRALMLAQDWTTVQLAWREDELTFHVRDPFPVGGVVEDPATGAAAAALGAYLRALGAIRPPATLTLHQGVDVGRPSLLSVQVTPGAAAPVQVTGTAVAIP